MRTLFIHAKNFRYSVRKKAIKNPEELGGVPGNHECVNCLISFISVEDGDLEGFKHLGNLYVKDLKKLVNELGVKHIVIYPYAHLSNRLAPPKEAVEVLVKLERLVKETLGDVAVVRAPFGWYKSFLVECVGHPLSELSRTYTIETQTPAISAVILDGEAKEFREDLKNSLIKQYLSKASGITTKYRMRQELLSKIMDLGLNWAQGKGGKYYALRTQPFKEMEEDIIQRELAYIQQLVNDVETLHIDECGVKAPSRLAGIALPDPGAAGECVSTHFRTPFFHTHSAFFSIHLETPEEGLELLRTLLRRILEVYEELGLTYLIEYMGCGKSIGDIADFHTSVTGKSPGIVAEGEGACTVTVIGLDSEGNLYDLGKHSLHLEENRVVLWGNILGPIENLFTLAVDSALTAVQQGKQPYLPAWLSPIQVRLIPVKNSHVGKAEEFLRALRDAGVRCDIDSRNIGLGKRIRAAGKKWIPYVGVIGDREAASGIPNFRVRKEGIQESIPLEELVKRVFREAPLKKNR